MVFDHEVGAARWAEESLRPFLSPHSVPYVSLNSSGCEVQLEVSFERRQMAVV